MTKLPLLPAALLSASLLFVACTPVLGAKPTLYQASSAEVLATVAQVCPALSPGAAYRPFVVASSSTDSVVCAAKPVSTSQVFNTYDLVTLRINAVQNGGPASTGSPVTSVTGMQNWGSTAITNQNALAAVFAALDQKFGRVP